jgi:hypothetical protein
MLHSSHNLRDRSCGEERDVFWGYPPLARGQLTTNKQPRRHQTNASERRQQCENVLCKSATEIAMDQQIDWQAVHVLAKLAALRAIKKQLQREGRVRVSLVPAGKLNALATLYLKAHPELLAEAARSDLARISANTHRSRRPGNQGLPLCKSHAQNGGPQ